MALPPNGSVWSYRKHPERLYEVLHVANIAHESPAHPPEVVYRTVNAPGHVWTRDLADFHRDFAPVPVAAVLADEPSTIPFQDRHEPGRRSATKPRQRCVDALRSILAAGKPSLSKPKYAGILAEAAEALAALEAAESATQNAVEIMDVLVCSTGHVTKEEAATLDAGKPVGDKLPTPLTWEYGWIFYVGSGQLDPDQEGLSEGFAGAIKAARSRGLAWIRFDADGPALDGVPYYEW